MNNLGSGLNIISVTNACGCILITKKITKHSAPLKSMTENLS